MKVLQVSRKIYTDKSTIGDIFFDNEFICSSLEDTIRNVKIAKHTAIPAGEYELTLSWSNRYGRLMPYILNVPFFTGIMIHWGNSDANTDGCILTGVYDPDKPDWIASSRKSFDELFAKIEKTIIDKEKIMVSIHGGMKKEDFIQIKKEG